MPSVLKKPVSKKSKKSKVLRSGLGWLRVFRWLIPAAAIVGMAAFVVLSQYTVTWRSPLLVRLQLPVVMTPRTSEEETKEAQADLGRKLTAFQQYACNKFGADCRIALAIQRAENPKGDCEIYHYNNDGTLDWGYFQINTVHLKRPNVNLRGLLDCRANIDFAYQLYTERGFQPWTTYRDGAYRKFLRNF
jgi:hypothetical protein